MKCTKLFFKGIVLTVFILSCLINTAIAVDQKMVLKLATLGQKGISSMIYLDEIFFPELTKAAGGQIAFDVYWGGVMGDEEDYIGKMRTGQLHGALVSGSGGITAAVCPDLSVLELPFLFNAWAWDEVNYVIDKIRPHIVKEAGMRDYKILMIFSIDFDQIYSTKQNIKSLEDLRSAKFLTWFGPLENSMLQALGVSAIPVNVPEVVSSIKTGIGDMAISPSFWWVGAQLYPDTKYVNPLPFRHVPGMMVMNLDKWSKIPDQQRKPMEALLLKNERNFRKVIKDCNEKSYKAMVKYGIKEVLVSPEELIRFKEASYSVWDELAGKSYSKEILDEVKGLLDNFRENKQDTVAKR